MYKIKNYRFEKGGLAFWDSEGKSHQVYITDYVFECGHDVFDCLEKVVGEFVVLEETKDEPVAEAVVDVKKSEVEVEPAPEKKSRKK